MSAHLALPMTLTEDQRWLLRSVGGWPIRDCLLGSAGVAHLMQSMYGSSGHMIEGGPQWLRGGFQCGRGKIVSPGWGGDPLVTVTGAQIKRYARELPQSVTDELRAIVKAQRAERQRIGDWCQCPYQFSPPNALADVCTSYHPSDQLVAEHYREMRRIDEWEERTLDLALGFAVADEPVGQLELFGVAS